MTARAAPGHWVEVRGARLVVVVLSVLMLGAALVACGARTPLEVLTAPDSGPPPLELRDSGSPVDSAPMDSAMPPPDVFVAPAYAETDDELYSVHPPAGQTTGVAPLGIRFDDIALHPNGKLYAVTSNGIYVVDPSSGAATLLNQDAGYMDALGAAPDGTLYSAGGGQLFTIDPATGNPTMILNFPDQLSASGDLAVMGTTLVVTLTDGTPNSADTLLSIDLTTMTSTLVGSTGFPCVWGLAVYGTLLFGFTCQGHILAIDPATAHSTILASPGDYFCGATQRQ